jgi:pyruvate/2-oxoglutarate dehydrogenase complex dihydrolipoamide acyltransferase (E2) component
MPDRYFVNSKHAEDLASGAMGEPGEWVTGVDPSNPFDRAKIAAGRFVPEHGVPTPKATDAASERAAELHVDLSNVTGSGSGGRITVGDVESAASSKTDEEESK